ncbi:MAG: hypothetical protein GX111_02505 [Clostridiales bacterium]|nr:hypothetical protein [Clostridiales bacterium]
MKTLYQLLFDEPSLLVPTLHEDDAFPGRYKKGYGKPELEINVLKIKKAIESLLKNMFFLGQGADVKLNKRQLKILSLLGINDPTKLPVAWTWMSARQSANQVAFAYCLFYENYVYTTDIYARLLGDKSFHKLVRWMMGQGYKPYDTYNTVWVNYQLMLTYANPAWGDESPKGGNEYKIRHTGISAQYDAYARNPVTFGLCIPYGLRYFLEQFNAMNQIVKDFIVERTKKCDGCRYCIQTDKTGKRPLACIPITHKQTTYKLCPYFPGYNYSWTHIDDNLVDKIVEFLAFMDGFANSMIRCKVSRP